MTMTRLLVTKLVLATFVLSLYAQNTWEGQAFWAEPGSLPETGLYAASNDFPRNTFLEVSLPRTGKTVIVEVLKRNVEGIDGPILVLSTEAASKLGLEPGESAQVVASVSSTLRSLPSTLAQERPTNPDPERNPQLLVQRTTPSNQERSQPATPVSPREPPPSSPPSSNVPSNAQPSNETEMGFEPRSVSPVVPPSPTRQGQQTVRPEFIGPSAGERPSVVRQPVEPAQARELPTPTFEPPAQVEAPRTSPRSPRIPPQPNLPLIAAKPPEGIRTSPPLRSPQVAEVHPDSPPAPSTPLERGPRAVSPRPILPQPEKIVIVTPVTRDEARVSPSLRSPLESNVVILPSLPDSVRMVQPRMPESEPRLVDKPNLVEQPRVVTPQRVPFEDRMVEVPRLTEQPRTVMPQPIPPEDQIVEMPRLTEQPRIVERNQPSEERIVELPRSEGNPRDVRPTVPQATSPQIETVPPAPQQAAQSRQPSTGLALVESQGSGGRRYVSRPQKPEGDVVGDVSIVEQLQPGGFYVQLGSYRDEAALFSALNSVKTYVPFVVQLTQRGMRLLAGPVTEGQVGLLLRHYQGQGFRDAFIIRPSR
jgi:hypothetical protein